MNISDQIKKVIFAAAKAARFEVKRQDIELEHPAALEHGDFATNVALKVKSPRESAEKIVAALPESAVWGKVAVANPGFINFWLSHEVLIGAIGDIAEKRETYGQNNLLRHKKIMVEYAHPNTHKELHIGHLRTLVTGEALSRIFEASQATVFRANYQGDIGPHVAKAISGTKKILTEKSQDLMDVEKLTLAEKAHLLGLGYVRGNKDYDADKSEIDSLNQKLYQKDPAVWPVYEQTRKWSLDYYNEFYNRFYTHFDRLYFESEVALPGKKIVLENTGKVFSESDGAIIFDGEKFGLHKRVFITSDGNPTYEGKEIGLAPMQFTDFPFDRCIHVVANEQAAYFQVVFKALELVDPKFIGRQYHLPMGMVSLVGKKISSRTGEIVTVEGLINLVKDLLLPLISPRDYPQEEKEKILEAVTIAAIKYSILKTSPLLNATFDLEKSVSLQGDSGPYLQYTYARAKSVLRKAQQTTDNKLPTTNDLADEELAILRRLYRFPEVVEAAAKGYSPNLICSYLFELAKRFNNLYNNCPILGNDLRFKLTSATAQVLKNGLNLLGIEALGKM